MEIKIGRSVNGGNDIQIPSKYKKASGSHATAIYINGKLYIRDDESKNGTFLGNREVAQEEIHTGDVLLLGGSDKKDPMVFVISYDEIKKKFDEIACANKTDYSNEFLALKKVYEDYNTEVKNLKEKARKKAAQQRIAIMSVGVLISVVGVLTGVTYLGSAVVVAGLVAGVIIKPAELKEEIIEINLKYKHDYRCPNPKCDKEFNLDSNTHHWKILEDGGCPHCNVKFKK